MTLDQPVEKLLGSILFPFHLNFEKTGTNTFVIFTNIESDSDRLNGSSKQSDANPGNDKKVKRGNKLFPVTRLVLDELGKPLSNV